MRWRRVKFFSVSLAGEGTELRWTFTFRLAVTVADYARPGPAGADGAASVTEITMLVSTRARGARSETSPSLIGSLPDRAAMEAFVKRLGRKRAEAATDQAHDLLDEASESGSARAQIAAVFAALQTSPLCTDAYLAVAQAFEPGAERVDILERAVAAGELALGPKRFAEMEGEFWGWFETRPYMRARHFLGLALDAAGRHAEAAETYADMLRLNPNDNQGVRYLLLDQLLLLDRRAEAAALIKRYKDDGAAHWLFDKALLAFRTGGDTAAARKALAAAIAQNPHVAPFLLGRKRLPKEGPQFVGWGDKAEAVAYVLDAGRLWTAAPAALAWLAAAVPASPPKPKPAARRRPT
jgi:tetratricopeptide (TPR) repeat protein